MYKWKRNRKSTPFDTTGCDECSRSVFTVAFDLTTASNSSFADTTWLRAFGGWAPLGVGTVDGALKVLIYRAIITHTCSVSKSPEFCFERVRIPGPQLN